MDCPDENTVAALFDKSLSSEEAARVEAHVDACSACRRLLGRLAGMFEETKGEEEAPAQEARIAKGTSVGRYVVSSTLGAGGMGIVFSAFDPELDRKVALKLVRMDRAREGGRARLLREAQSMAKLSHPNVVSVYDAGTFGDRVFLAMELVDGVTLTAWLREERTWREVLRVFLEAGRGLAAAHAAGLVHRDFKPDNVLVSRRGEVKVTDFGLARAAETRASDRPPPSSEKPRKPLPHGATTRTGAVLGTPAYMAPEQTRGQADARSDQYSFCVALYEAIHHERPSPKAAPGMSVPSRVHAAIERGLSASPADRFPTMDALLAALSSEGPLARRKLVLVALVAALVASLAVLAFAKRPQSHQAMLCSGGASKLDGIWDTERRRATSEAFAKSGKPFADDVFREVERGLDTYARVWVAAHDAACGMRVRGEESDLALSLRMVCLEQRREEMRALTDLLVRGDADVVQRAVSATQALTKVDGCNDVVALGKRTKPPDDPAARAKLEEVRRDLAKAKALEDSGRFADGLAIAKTCAAAAIELRFKPLEAEALFRRGVLENRSGDAATADTTLRDAVLAAEAAGDDPLAARGWVARMAAASSRAIFDRAEEYMRHAEAILDRIPGQELTRAELAIRRGTMRQGQGKYADAEASQREAIAILEKVVGPDHTSVARSLTFLASVLTIQGRYEESLATYARSLEIQEHALGHTHPDVATTLSDVGIVYGRQGSYAQAVDYFRRSIAIWEKTQGPDHRDLERPLNNLAMTLDMMGEHKEARAILERSLALCMKGHGHDHPATATALSNLGVVLEHLGELAQARARVEEAIAIKEKVLGAQHRTVGLSLDALAHIALAQGKANEAIDFYTRAIAILEKTPGPDNPELAPPLTGLGRAYLATGKAALAIAPLERAIALNGKRKTADEQIGETCFALARAVVAKDRTRAADLAKQALDAYTRAGASFAKDRAEVAKWLDAHP